MSEIEGMIPGYRVVRIGTPKSEELYIDAAGNAAKCRGHEMALGYVVVEKIEDWVELTPEEYGWHKIRDGVDQVFGSAFGLDKWLDCKNFTKTIGELTNSGDAQQRKFRYRCLRENLPVKPKLRFAKLNLCVSKIAPFSGHAIRGYDSEKECPEAYLPVMFDGANFVVQVPFEDE